MKAKNQVKAQRAVHPDYQKTAGVENSYPLKVTITQTGDGGHTLIRGNYWKGQMADGTAVNVYLTAKVRTLKTPTLRVGQVVRVRCSPWDQAKCEVATSDVHWVSPSKLSRLAKKHAKKPPRQTTKQKAKGTGRKVRR
jgi:hypothetical protein